MKFLTNKDYYDEEGNHTMSCGVVQQEQYAKVIGNKVYTVCKYCGTVFRIHSKVTTTHTCELGRRERKEFDERYPDREHGWTDEALGNNL